MYYTLVDVERTSHSPPPPCLLFSHQRYDPLNTISGTDSALKSNGDSTLTQIIPFGKISFKKFAHSK